MGIVASILTIAVGLIGYSEISENNIANNDGVIYKGDNNTIVNMINDPSSYSVSHILTTASALIDTKKGENYVEAAKLLNLEKMQSNKEAMCNLGYLYAHGYGVEKDVVKAENLYLKSYEAGCNQAMVNRFVLYKDNIARDNEYERKIYLTINEISKDPLHSMHKEIKSKYGTELLQGNVEDIRKIQCSAWKDTGIIKDFREEPSYNFREVWVFMKSSSDESNSTYGRYRTYKQQKRECSFDNLFQDDIV